MKRIALIVFFLFLIFITTPLVVIPLVFMVSLTIPYIFYEMILFGVILDIVTKQDFPYFGIGALVLLIVISFIRKRMSIHV